MTIEDNDERELRCRRLGHMVRFRYCRTQEGRTVCPHILNCWWEVFDVEDFLREELPEEDFARLRKRSPRDKVGTLLDILQRVQERSGAAGADAEQAETE